MFWFKRNEHKKGIYQKQTDSAKYFLDTGYYKAIEPYSFRDRKEGVGVYKKVDNSSYLWLPRIGEEVNKIVEPERSVNYNDFYGEDLSSFTEAIKVNDFAYPYCIINPFLGDMTTEVYFPSDSNPDNFLVQIDNLNQGYDSDFKKVAYFPQPILNEYEYYDFSSNTWKTYYGVLTYYYGYWIEYSERNSAIIVYNNDFSHWSTEVFYYPVYPLAWFIANFKIYRGSTYYGEHESFAMLVRRYSGQERLYIFVFHPSFIYPIYVDDNTLINLRNYISYTNSPSELKRASTYNNLYNFPHGSIKGLNYYKYKFEINVYYGREATITNIITQNVPLNFSIPINVKIGNIYTKIWLTAYNEGKIFYYKGKIWASFIYNDELYVCPLTDFSIPATPP